MNMKILSRNREPSGRGRPTSAFAKRLLRGVPRGWVCAALLMLLLAPCQLVAQQPEVPPATRNFMQAKLAHSQKVLEGLSLENYDLIVKHAQELSLLSMESQWQFLRTQRYVDQSADFRHAIQHLIDAAKKHDIDAVALAYVDVTLKCVHCHKYVRDGASKEGISQRGGASLDAISRIQPLK